jgi:ABC-type siderophore export system fused ATPase/permease subunit
MKLQDLIIAVKEQHLDKEQLEDYRNQMSQVFAEMMLEIADLEKKEALFMGKDFGENVSVAQRKILWKITEEGQRLIVLKRYCLATKELLNSLKSRLYSIY